MTTTTYIGPDSTWAAAVAARASFDMAVAKALEAYYSQHYTVRDPSALSRALADAASDYARDLTE